MTTIIAFTTERGSPQTRFDFSLKYKFKIHNMLAIVIVVWLVSVGRLSKMFSDLTAKQAQQAKEAQQK